MSDFEERIKRDAEDACRVVKLAIKLPCRFNRGYRLLSQDIPELLKFAESAGATSSDVMRWYANGSECRDRPSVLATYHPMIHKRDGEWERIYATAIMLAKSLERWIWLTLGEDRWVRIMVGGDPKRLASGSPLAFDSTYHNDQFITTISPTGEEHFVGVS